MGQFEKSQEENKGFVAIWIAMDVSHFKISWLHILF